MDVIITLTLSLRGPTLLQVDLLTERVTYLHV